MQDVDVFGEAQEEPAPSMLAKANAGTHVNGSSAAVSVSPKDASKAGAQLEPMSSKGDDEEIKKTSIIKAVC